MSIEESQPHVTYSMLVDGLGNLGLTEGDVVLVHSSLSRFGYVEGGADTVVDALLAAVGAEGTVAVPTSPVTWRGGSHFITSSTTQSSTSGSPHRNLAQLQRRCAGDRRPGPPSLLAIPSTPSAPAATGSSPVRKPPFILPGREPRGTEIASAAGKCC